MVSDEQIKRMCDEGVGKLTTVKLLMKLEEVGLADAVKRINELDLHWSSNRGSGSKGLYSETYQQISGKSGEDILMEQGRAAFKTVLDLGEAEMRGFAEAYRDFKKQEGIEGTVFSMLESDKS